jgi:hypothetical protein
MGEERVHYGYTSDGYLGACGSYNDERRTAIRLVTCEYCQNVIDELLQHVLDFGLAPAPTKKGGG